MYDKFSSLEIEYDETTKQFVGVVYSKGGEFASVNCEDFETCANEIMHYAMELIEETEFGEGVEL